MPVTEIATISLVPGSDITDEGSNAADTWKSMCDTVSRQDGCEDLFYGPELESPDVAQLFVNWDNIQSHKKFMASPDYEPMLEHIKPILSGPPHLIHFEFDSPGSLTSALSSPIVELATFYIPFDKRSSFDSHLDPFRQTLTKHAEGFVVMSFGWSVEDVEHKNFGEGEKGKACLCAIGWQSLEAHMAYRETDAFRGSVGFMREIPKAVELHHVKTA